MIVEKDASLRTSQKTIENRAIHLQSKNLHNSVKDPLTSIKQSRTTEEADEGVGT
jgi:hypothetical protein